MRHEEDPPGRVTPGKGGDNVLHSPRDRRMAKRTNPESCLNLDLQSERRQLRHQVVADAVPGVAPDWAGAIAG